MRSGHNFWIGKILNEHERPISQSQICYIGHFWDLICSSHTPQSLTAPSLTWCLLYNITNIHGLSHCDSDRLSHTSLHLTTWTVNPTLPPARTAHLSSWVDQTFSVYAGPPGLLQEAPPGSLRAPEPVTTGCNPGSGLLAPHFPVPVSVRLRTGSATGGDEADLPPLLAIDGFFFLLSEQNQFSIPDILIGIQKSKCVSFVSQIKVFDIQSQGTLSRRVKRQRTE